MNCWMKKKKVNDDLSVIVVSKGLFIWEAGRDVCRDGTLFIPGLHKNVSTWDDFTRDNLQSQHNIVPAKRDGVFI